MKDIGSKMYYRLYDVIHYKIEMSVHKTIHEQGSKYVRMINTIRGLRTLTTF